MLICLQRSYSDCIAIRAGSLPLRNSRTSVLDTEFTRPPRLDTTRMLTHQQSRQLGFSNEEPDTSSAAADYPRPGGELPLSPQPNCAEQMLDLKSTPRYPLGLEQCWSEIQFQRMPLLRELFLQRSSDPDVSDRTSKMQDKSSTSRTER